MLLNDSSCKNARAKLKTYKLNDGEGLWLFIQPNGKKYWKLKYNCNNKENTLSFGAYPEVSLRDARDKRDKAKTDLKNGDDPSILRKEAKQLALYNSSQTFEAISREWHDRYINNWSPKQAARILRRLENELFDNLGRYPINKLPRKILLVCLQKAAERSPELGKRLLGYCKQIFEFAGLTDRLDKDLTLGVKAALPKYISGHFACIELEQLPDFIKAIYSPPPTQHKLANQAARLAMLFGCRTMEMLKSERSKFNLDAATWIIISDNVKKSAEQRRIKRDHLVPLSKQAITIILELDREYGENRKYLLPSPVKENQPVCKNIILGELDRLGYKSVMTTHGFRSLFMSVSTEKLKYRMRIVDRQLGHVPKGEVLRTYDRAKYLDDRIKLMQDYADYLDSLFKPQQTERNNHGNSSRCSPTISNYYSNSTSAVKFESFNTQQAYQIRDVS
ncbi:MAG: integrase arm-type DNA-binding domain-containing protein [Mucilaginibacter sp.]|uniref:tyrosine-type recombinase/integrase n=1 Tax=Mucilaginibacter sp. TaxID=1882438 RepID=UPI0032658FCE